MDLDISALESQLLKLREERIKAKSSLDAMRPGRGRGRGVPGLGGRGYDPPARAGVFSRLGSFDRDGPRELPSTGRASVFDRVQGAGRQHVRQHDRDEQRNGSYDRRQGLEPASSIERKGSARDDLRDDDRSARLAAASEPSTNSRPPISSRLSSQVVVPPRSSSAEANDRGLQDVERLDSIGRNGSLSGPADHEAQKGVAGTGSSRKRLLSAVVVGGETRSFSRSSDPGDAAAAAAAAEREVADEPPAKRPALVTDEKSKRRARNMLSNLLLGTLKKFKDEDAAFRQSSTAQRRQELEKRASLKAEAEDARIREEAAAARRQEKEAKIEELRTINLQAQRVELEIYLAKRIHRRQQLLSFCVTKTQPPLHWQPAQHTEETQALLQDHAAAFDEWKQQQMQQLEADKAALAEEAAARRDAAAARLTARQHGPQDRDDEGGADGNDSAGEQAGEPVDGAYEEMEDDDSAPAAEAAADEAYGTAAEEQHGVVPADGKLEDVGADFEEQQAGHQSSNTRGKHELPEEEDDEEEERLLVEDEDDDM